MRLPGGLVRFGRDRLRVASVALLAIVLLATAGIQSAAATALQSTLDAHWRGAYDILVTAKSPVRSGLLAPDSLGSGEDRMPLADLARIRAVDGVGVAAPIAQIAIPALDYGRLNVAVPIDHAQTTMDPREYRLHVKYVTDDGLGERIALAETYRLTLDASAAPRDVPVDPLRYGVGGSCEVGGVTVECPAIAPDTEVRYNAMVLGESPGAAASGYSNFTNTYGEDDVVFPLPPVAVAPTRVTLIDPVAERELLGDAGGFLDPLIATGTGDPRSIGALSEWSATRPADPFTAVIDEAAEQERLWIDDFEHGELYAAYVAAMEENGDEPRPAAEVGWVPRYIPVIVAPQEDTALRLEVEIERLGPGVLPDISKSSFSIPAVLEPSAVGTPVGTISTDVSSLLDAFSTTPITLDWPGTATAHDEQAVAAFIGNYFGPFARPAPTVPQVDDGRLSLDATGYVSGPNQRFWGGDAGGWVLPKPPDGAGLGADPGTQSAYSTVQADQTVQDSTTVQASLLPIASFDVDEAGLETDPLSYVPLGAYDPATITRVADATGATTDPVEMLPSAGGLGLVGARTTAIADIGAASGAMADPTVDAVRVRVAGVDAYDRAGIARVNAVASDIERLGLAATIVAGSSRQETRIRVDGYAFGTMDADGEQTVGSLGVVTQDWSQLGAAARVGTSVSQAALSLLVAVLAATLALYAAASFAGQGGRRADAVTLRSIGWTRWRIRRWMLAEQWPAIGAVSAAAAAALVVTAGDPLVRSVAGGVVLAVVAIGVAGSVLSSRAGSVRLATDAELSSHRDARPRLRWSGDAVDDGPSDVAAADDGHGSARSERRRPRGRLGALSIAGFGARLLRGDPAAAVWAAVSILIVMATAATLVLSIDLGRQGAGSSRLAVFGAAQALAPQVALGASGLAAGALLVVLQRRATLRTRSRSRALLRDIGWTAADIRKAERAEVLSIGLPTAFAGSYLLWFALTAAGLGDLETAISVALLAGLAVVVALLITTRKVGGAL